MDVSVTVLMSHYHPQQASNSQGTMPRNVKKHSFVYRRLQTSCIQCDNAHSVTAINKHNMHNYL